MRYYIVYSGPGRYRRHIDGDLVFFYPLRSDEKEPVRSVYDVSFDDRKRLVLVEDVSTRFRRLEPCDPWVDSRPPQRIVAELGEEIDPDVYHLILYEV